MSGEPGEPEMPHIPLRRHLERQREVGGQEARQRRGERIRMLALRRKLKRDPAQLDGVGDGARCLELDPAQIDMGRDARDGGMGEPARYLGMQAERARARQKALRDAAGRDEAPERGEPGALCRQHEIGAVGLGRRHSAIE